LLYTIVMMITQAVNIHISIQQIHNSTLMLDILGNCCSQHSNSSLFCCGSNYPYSQQCCPCYYQRKIYIQTYNKTCPSLTNSTELVQNCSLFFYHLTNVNSSGTFSVTFSSGGYATPDTNQLCNNSKLGNYGCKDSSCLKVPPALDIDSWKRAIFFGGGALFLNVGKLLLQEYMYKHRAYDLHRYGNRPTSLGIYWGWNNNDYWTWLLSPNGKWKSSLTSIFFDFYAGFYNVAACFYLIDVYHASGQGGLDGWRLLFSILYALLMLIYNLLMFLYSGLCRILDDIKHLCCFCCFRDEDDDRCGKWRITETILSLIIIIVSGLMMGPLAPN